MTRVTATTYSSGSRGAQKPKNLKEYMASHKRLEIGQILTQNTNGYRKKSVGLETAPQIQQELTNKDVPQQEKPAQQAMTPKTEQVKAQPSTPEAPNSEQPKTETPKQDASTPKTEQVSKQEANTPKAEQQKVETPKQTPVAQHAEAPKAESAAQAQQAAKPQEKRPKSTSISGRRYYEKKIGIYKDTRPKNLAELRKQRKKLEVGQTLKQDTNGYKKKNNKTTQATEAVHSNNNAQQPADVKEVKTNTVQTPENKPEVKPQTNNTSPKTEAKQAVVSDAKGEIAAKQTKPSIVLNERGTYDAKIAGEPTRTFYSKEDAQKFIDNFNKKAQPQAAGAKPSIVLNERGTYDAKIAGEPTRTFYSKEDAQKFIDNFTGKTQNAANQALKFMSDGAVEYNGVKYASLEQCQKAHPEIKFTTQAPKGNLTPIQADKAPFSKKFWGDASALTKDAKLNYAPEVKTFQLGAGSKAGLTPIQAGKAPFSKKFWGDASALTKDAKLNYAPEVKTFQLGAGSKAGLTPIQAGKAPFSKKFWGDASALAKDAKLQYTPNPSVVKLGANAGEEAVEQVGKSSINKIKQIFNSTNIKNVFKSRGGKFGVIAAGVAAVGAGVAAIAASNSGKKGFTTKYIQSPDGYVDLLKNYEQTHGTEISYKTLDEAMK